MTTTTPDPTRNLVLVHSEGWQDIADLYAIKALVEQQALDIEVFIASNTTRSSLTRKRAAARPSLIFSPIRLLAFSPDRGRVYQGTPMSKLAEMQRLAAAGLPVPTFEPIEPDTRLPQETYGSHVIVKPSFAFASWGHGIELWRTDRLRYRKPEDYPPDHPGRHAPMIAQRFINSGRAMSCRVLTLFGRPLFTYLREVDRPIVLDPARDCFDQAEYLPAPPGVRVSMPRDPDLLALAAAAYEAIPEAALQACDIIKDREGRLFLLEVNPGGGTWMFSSANAGGYRKALGIDDLTAPFDAFRQCAGALIERTRREAC